MKMTSRGKFIKGLKHTAKLNYQPSEELIGDVLDIIYGHAIFNEEYTTQLIFERFDQAITQHLLDVIERAKPEKLTLNPKTYDRNEYEMRAYNQAIDQFHQNIIKELEE